jgi:maleate cis-trans isomerase
VRSPTRELPPARNRLWLYCVQHRAGARGVAISPYTAEVDAAEHRFFAEGGLETVAGAHLGIGDGFGLAEPEPKAILDLALGACKPSADGIVIACVNFRSHPIIDTLEADRQPVVTSTQAALWHTLCLAGVPLRSTAGAVCYED